MRVARVAMEEKGGGIEDAYDDDETKGKRKEVIRVVEETPLIALGPGGVESGFLNTWKESGFYDGTSTTQWWMMMMMIMKMMRNF